MRVTATDYTLLSTRSCVRPKRGPDTQDDIKKALLEAVFANASHSDTRDSNRRKLYAIWKVGILELEASSFAENDELATV